MVHTIRTELKWALGSYKNLLITPASRTLTIWIETNPPWCMKKRPSRCLFDEQFKHQKIETASDMLPRLSRMIHWEALGVQLDEADHGQDLNAYKGYGWNDVKEGVTVAGMNDCVLKQPGRNKAPSEGDKQRNKNLDRVHARVGHVFGSTHKQRHGLGLRGIGLARATFRVWPTTGATIYCNPCTSTPIIRGGVIRQVNKARKWRSQAHDEPCPDQPPSPNRSISALRTTRRALAQGAQTRGCIGGRPLAWNMFCA